MIIEVKARLCECHDYGSKLTLIERPSRAASVESKPPSVEGSGRMAVLRIVFSLPKSGVPRPVTGSQPTEACTKRELCHGVTACKVGKATHAETLSTAPRCVPTRHVIQATYANGVQHRIEESKGGLARGELRVV